MDDTMKKIQENLIEIEIEAENFLLARQQMVENDRVRNGNREALTALRKRARTTKTSVPSPFESIMKEIEGMGSKPLVKEVCATCGNHDSTEKTWMMFPGTDIFSRIPFHAAHTILEKGCATHCYTYVYSYVTRTLHLALKYPCRTLDIRTWTLGLGHLFLGQKHGHFSKYYRVRHMDMYPCRTLLAKSE
ncbi:uncharacterized protein LOC108200770 isoform X1 [Daucus carota subsp. sativus]|uniref:uncharacterized protein LOC108200770 isoform X1 n=1 Tax=Daucus carota subsp. sativus TaxID=79200 RepID=UPI0007EFA0CA|nr:PREDICTED: uncharacterized protein LOC108200770 isoform X1 [Daucus carota subsp. sativus]XP_017224507.1 PREDICTED: uncharacterized protein LOC108200770 isoform X1 [Daucus carota subsp. sativus]